MLYTASPQALAELESRRGGLPEQREVRSAGAEVAPSMQSSPAPPQRSVLAFGPGGSLQPRPASQPQLHGQQSSSSSAAPAPRAQAPSTTLPPLRPGQAPSRSGQPPPPAPPPAGEPPARGVSPHFMVPPLSSSYRVGASGCLPSQPPPPFPPPPAPPPPEAAGGSQASGNRAATDHRTSTPDVSSTAIVAGSQAATPTGAHRGSHKRQASLATTESL